MISIAETLLVPADIVFATCSVFSTTLATFTSVANRFVMIWATSTALEMAFPLAFRVRLSPPLCIWVRQART